jgi:hypothetical protein
MVDQKATYGRRARRSTEVIRRLERARERNNRQLAAVRDREQRVEQALREYFAASEQADAVERTYAQRIERLEVQIEQLRAECAARLGDVRSGRARALFVVHESGRTVRQVAELVELSEKATRQLIGMGRCLPTTKRSRRPGPAGEGGQERADEPPGWPAEVAVQAQPAVVDAKDTPEASASASATRSGV